MWMQNYCQVIRARINFNCRVYIYQQIMGEHTKREKSIRLFRAASRLEVVTLWPFLSRKRCSHADKEKSWTAIPHNAWKVECQII